MWPSTGRIPLSYHLGTCWLMVDGKKRMDGRAYDTKLVLGLVVIGSQLLQSDAERNSAHMEKSACCHGFGRERSG